MLDKRSAANDIYLGQEYLHTSKDDLCLDRGKWDKLQGNYDLRKQLRH